MRTGYDCRVEEREQQMSRSRVNRRRRACICLRTPEVPGTMASSQARGAENRGVVRESM